MNRETKLMNQIQAKASGRGYRLFRNNVGLTWTGKPVPVAGTPHVLLRYARRVRMGLAPGSSDLIGWKPVIITPDMVGQVFAQFVAWEIKVPGKKPTPQQKRFSEIVNIVGGEARFLSSVSEADPDGDE